MQRMRIKTFSQPQRLSLANIQLKVYTKEMLSHEQNKLIAHIDDILNERTLSVAYEELYSAVENLCTLRMEDVCLMDLKRIVSLYLNEQLVILGAIERLDFLMLLNTIWNGYVRKCHLLQNIYLYLEACHDRRKQARRKCGTGVWQLCIEMFRTEILMDPNMSTKLTYLFDVIDEVRKEESDVLNESHQFITQLVSMLSQLDLYSVYFEESYLQRTNAYFLVEREMMFARDIIDYFRYVTVTIGKECARVRKHFQPTTEALIYQLLYKLFIADMMQHIGERLRDVNVFDCEFDDILTVYEEMRLTPPGKDLMIQLFANYMNAKGKNIMHERNELYVIECLLRFKDRINHVIVRSLDNEECFLEAVRTCFKDFINQRKNKAAQFLAKFINVKMRDKQIPEELLDQIMVIFRYIQGKDVFEAYYKRHLAKRLLLGTSSSQDAEKYMIGKLKTECGDGFTTKMEGMFRDMDLSETLSQAFKAQQAGAGAEDIEFSAYILTNSFWPTFSKFRVVLEDSMLRYPRQFAEYYHTKYTGRSLDWIGSLDSCLISANLHMGKRELLVSLYQALVLLQFNSQTTVTFKAMQECLDLDVSELIRTLHSLTGSRCAILKINSASPLCAYHTFRDEDACSVNEAFRTKLYRLKINQLQYKDTEEEQRITESSVMCDRQLQIDAAVVRLMKQRKSMMHNDLMAEMLATLKFPINPNDISKRIELLIGREFLMREPNDENTYMYVA